jgi:hypothetical protein
MKSLQAVLVMARRGVSRLYCNSNELGRYSENELDDRGSQLC